MFESEEALPWREPIGARRDDQRYAVHVAQVLGARLGGDEVEVLVEAWSVGLSVEGLDLEELRRLLDGDVGAEAALFAGGADVSLVGADAQREVLGGLGGQTADEVVMSLAPMEDGVA